MDDQLQNELRTLRARAYGPDSDIHDDPPALTRLQDLEELARGAAPAPHPPAPPLPPSPTPPVASAPLPDDSVEPESTEPATPVSTEPTEPAAEHTPRRRRWTTKRLVLTWLASLGVAILVTATVTGFVSRRIQADPREIAVLGVDAFAEWPGIFGNYTDDGESEPGMPEGSAAFQAFHGLAFFRMNNGMFSYGGDQSCLLVVDSAKIDNDSNSFNGLILNGCAAGTFPATVEVVITKSFQELPDELLEAFPEGTALQFVLDGDEVVVLSDQE